MDRRHKVCLAMALYARFGEKQAILVFSMKKNELSKYGKHLGLK